MINQLCLFPEEANYLSELVQAKHYRPTGEIQYFTNLFVNRRGELYSNKTGKMKKRTAVVAGGYVKLGVNHKMYLVHRIVACTFLTNINREKKTQVDHLDGNKENNHIFNLEWVTSSENLKRISRVKDKCQTRIF